MSKIALPFKELNAEMTMTFNRENIETILKWYLEQLHGKTVKDFKMRFNDATNYELTVRMTEKVKPIAEVVDNKQSEKATPASEVDLTI
jgi:DNA-binding protein Fis